ncbi:MAG: hypothetical protein IKP82_09095 [Oscillospiraceae bacterium]|nr:hypothetical protein [Oscillospiraceae bacterium]
MKQLETLFLHTKMRWKTVLLLALGCGLAVGLLMVPEALASTSLQQPGISYEFWIFMALFILLNCEKPWEAGVKTFVFFLISQPLIYLVQVPFSPWHWDLLRYYPRWGLITLLTLPGAALGWYVRKEKWYSVLLLAVLNVILCLELPSSVRALAEGFPRYLLSTAFIVFELVFFTLLLFKNKKLRALSFALTLVLLAGSVWETVWFERNATFITAAQIETGTAPYELLAEPEGVQISVENSFVRVELKQHDYRTVEIRLRDAAGEIVEMTLDYSEEGTRWR